VHAELFQGRRSALVDSLPLLPGRTLLPGRWSLPFASRIAFPNVPRVVICPRRLLLFLPMLRRFADSPSPLRSRLVLSGSQVPNDSLPVWLEFLERAAFVPLPPPASRTDSLLQSEQMRRLERACRGSLKIVPADSSLSRTHTHPFLDSFPRSSPGCIPRRLFN